MTTRVFNKRLILISEEIQQDVYLHERQVNPQNNDIIYIHFPLPEGGLFLSLCHNKDLWDPAPGTMQPVDFQKLP